MNRKVKKLADTRAGTKNMAAYIDQDGKLLTDIDDVTKNRRYASRNFTCIANRRNQKKLIWKVKNGWQKMKWD